MDCDLRLTHKRCPQTTVLHARGVITSSNADYARIEYLFANAKYPVLVYPSMVQELGVLRVAPRGDSSPPLQEIGLP